MAGFRKAILALWIGVGILLGACPQYAWSEGVLILKSRDIGPFQQAVDGLTAVLDSAGVRVVTYIHESEEGAEPLDLVRIVAEEDLTIVVPIGTVATDRVLELHLDIPTVFCMVLDPVGRGFVVDLERPGGSTTGVEMNIPISAQFEALRETVPDAKRVGVLYSTTRNRQLIDQAVGIADSMGLKLVPAEISSDEAVPHVLRDLIGGIDVLWGIADPVAFSSISTEHIILTTLRNRVPFMGLSASFVKAGALLALSCNYEDIGRQAGEKVLLIMAGESPGSIPVTFPRATALHLSLKTARLIGIDIPAAVVSKAKEVRQ